MKPGSREASVAAVSPVNEPDSAASNGLEDGTGGLVDDQLAADSPNVLGRAPTQPTAILRAASGRG